MKSTAQRTGELRHRRSAALVEERIQALFSRMPLLSGFSLRHDLEIADIEFHTWPGYTAVHQLHEELAQALADLVEVFPETVALMNGRTFARMFH